MTLRLLITKWLVVVELVVGKFDRGCYCGGCKILSKPLCPKLFLGLGSKRVFSGIRKFAEC